MPKPPKCRATVRRLTVAVTASVAAISTTSAPSDAAPTDDCAPITCVANYLDVTTSVLNATIVTETRNFHGLGQQRALDLLAEATAAKLAAHAPSPRAEFVGASWIVLEAHDHLRGLIIDNASEAVGALRS
jgi:hypothetical protein